MSIIKRCRFRPLFFLTLLLAFNVGGLQGYDRSPPCFKKIAADFFHPESVALALSLSRDQVSQAQWFRIAQELRRKGKALPAKMKLAAAKMRPNPLEDVFNAEAAKEILRKEANSLFIEVMEQFDITNAFTRQELFRNIWGWEEMRIDACLEPYYPKKKPDSE